MLAQYPFDVLIGSVHWLGTWQFDDIHNDVQMVEWTTRDVDDCWRLYAESLGELAECAAVDVLAHPDLIKVAGFQPASRDEFWEHMADAAARADISVECSSAGWFKPVNEAYPAPGFLDRLVSKGVTFTTASDAHHRERVSTRVGELATMLEERGVAERGTHVELVEKKALYFKLIERQLTTNKENDTLLTLKKKAKQK